MDGPGKFQVIMGYIGLVSAFVCEHLPVFSICRLPENILVVDTLNFSKKGGIHVLICIINLYGVYIRWLAQVGLYPFMSRARGSAPIGPDVFIHGVMAEYPP